MAADSITPTALYVRISTSNNGQSPEMRTNWLINSTIQSSAC